AILVATIAYQIVSAAAGAMMTAVARRYSMAGRLGSLAGMAAAAPGVLAALAGGWLAAHVSPRRTFLLAAALPLAILAQAVREARGGGGGRGEGGRGRGRE